MNPKIFQHNVLPSDDSFETSVPTVPYDSIAKYRQYVERAYLGASEPSFKDLSIYEINAAQL